MADELQRTLNAPIKCSGIALHTGGRSHLTIRPAPAGSGIVVKRVDLPDQPTVQAHARYVVDVQRATTLCHGAARVHTVEHVLAALYGNGIDNALIEMDGSEPPIVDGSSAPFVKLIEGVGTVEQDQPRRVFHVREPLYYEHGQTRIVVLPDTRYRISCTVQFGVSVMDTQYLSLELADGVFNRELSLARTFARYSEIEPLMVKGLIRGGSLDNAVILKGNAIISKDGLRYPDELVRHKMLDIVGDLSLIGCRLVGHVIAIMPGHPSNVATALKLVAQIDAQAAAN